MKNPLSAGLALFGVSLNALADIKPDPGDYTALPKGTNMAVLYQHVHDLFRQCKLCGCLIRHTPVT